MIRQQPGPIDRVGKQPATPGPCGSAPRGEAGGPEDERRGDRWREENTTPSTDFAEFARRRSNIPPIGERQDTGVEAGEGQEWDQPAQDLDDWSGSVITALSHTRRVKRRERQNELPEVVRRSYDQPVRHRISPFPQSPICSTARNASCGISTDPTCFMRRFPAFCFSSNLRLREISPP